MKRLLLPLTVLFFSASLSLKAQESATDLAKAAQNPLANIISFPFQNNTNFGYGPNNKRTQNILNIQPVVPLMDGKIITRTIFPILWQPDFSESSGTISGLSNVQFTAFYVPKSKGITWGFGPIVSFPAANDNLGSAKLSVGPSLVALKIGEKWVYGGVINNTFSVAGPSDAPDVNNFYAQIFVNYNLPKGLYLNTAPIITANWEADSGQQWTVPIGAGIGKIVKLGGKLPINLQAGYYYNIVSPDFGPESQLRVQAVVMLPTSILKKSK
ncbi:neuromedin U [Xanthomarina sp. GH4-25]|uniref:neuromedin U n=1 Tax=Xanthomarina sp. GH4-25 TaxID=3349335 RepID=UPI0038779CF1